MVLIIHLLTEFFAGVEKGFRQMAEKGLLSGHKLAGIKFRLQDGAHHIVDSSELAFMLAAHGAVKEVFSEGAWQILGESDEFSFVFL